MGIKVDDLLPRKRFVIPDVFEVDLHDLERLGAVPINELSFCLAETVETCGSDELALVAAQNVADRAWWDIERFIFR